MNHLLIETRPRRVPRPPNPEIVQAVEDKLSILDEPSSSNQPGAGGTT
jgi:hypothetical protein